MEEKEGRITTVFVIFRHDDGDMSHSLYAIEMPNPLITTPTPTRDDHHHHHQHQPTSKLKCCQSKPLLQYWSLIHEFPASKYPFSMCCAKLGDRLFFLGGLLDPKRNSPPFPDLTPFPRSVHAFTPSTGKLEEVAPMNTGKNRPLSFVADDNLYVLGCPIKTKEESSSPIYFEVFEHERWTALQPPTCLASWKGCSAAVGRKVLVLGHAGLQLVCFAFNLDTREWAEILLRQLHRLPLWTYSLYVEGCSKKNDAAALYGVGSDGRPCKLFITEGQTEQVHKLLTFHDWNQISLIQEDDAAGPGRRRVGVDPFFIQEGYCVASRSLCYLRDGCFFYLAVGSPSFDLVADQFIQTVLFTDISSQLGDVHDEAHPSSATQAFKAECIHSAHGQINPSVNHIWMIKNSFAFPLTRKQINILTGAPEGGAGSLNTIATRDKGVLEIMSSILSIQECEVQNKCEQKIREEEIQAPHQNAIAEFKHKTLKEMEREFGKRVVDVDPDIRVQIAKELALQLLDKYAGLTQELN